MLSARNGCTFRSWSTTASGSSTVRMRMWQYESHCTAAGVHGLATSASPATRSTPPYVAGASGAWVESGGGNVAGFDVSVTSGASGAVVCSLPLGAVVGAVSPLSSFLLPHAAATNARLSATAPTRQRRPVDPWCTVRFPLLDNTRKLD